MNKDHLSALQKPQGAQFFAIQAIAPSQGKHFRFRRTASDHVTGARPDLLNSESGKGINSSQIS
jgi:hypothetical protein